MAFNEPVWRSVRTVQLVAVPAAQRRWLLDRASLTMRLCAACEGRFRVQVLQQGWRPCVAANAAWPDSAVGPWARYCSRIPVCAAVNCRSPD